jgi:hypothetical protein
MDLYDVVLLKEWLHYDQLTGVFTWLKNRGSRKVSGLTAGCALHTGHVQIMFAQKAYLAHRLAWIYMTGQQPLDMIDHINGNPGDNRWGNLRACTHAENMKNRKIHSNNKCGFKGVWKDCSRALKPYVAEIRANGKKTRIGRFETAELAHEAYIEAALKLHGNFSRTGPA